MDDVEPMTHDDAAGMAWWNAMSEEARRFWLKVALTAVPAEAWTYYKQVMSDPEPLPRPHKDCKRTP